MPDPPSETQLQSLIERVFSVFDLDPQAWPDVVQINRSGYSDANVRGIWTFQERVDFINVPLPEGMGEPSPSIGLKPDSSGSAD